MRSLNINVHAYSIEPYQKGGFVCSFRSETETEDWRQIPYYSLQQGQKLGRNWIISGDISSELVAWTNESAISGLESIEMQILSNE